VTAEELDALRRLANAATEGPWFRYGSAPYEVYANPDGYPDGDSPYITAGSESEANADFIAACREAVPDLIDDVERLRDHSVTLNSIGWKIAAALGEVPDGADQIAGNAEDLADRLLAELARLRESAGEQS
jgi:hypothetical protein